MTSTQRAQIAGASAALVAFAVVVQQVMADGWLVDVDVDLVETYSQHPAAVQRLSLYQRPRPGRVVDVARLFSPFGDAGLLLLAIGVVTVILYRRGLHRQAAFVVTAAVGGAILDLVTRTIIGQLRPSLPIPDFARDGLPSGHALDATVCYGALLVIVWPRLSRLQRIVAALGTSALVAAVSYSRVVTVVHYLSDVVGGVTLGVAWLLLVAAAFSLPQRGNRLPPAA